MTAQTNYLQPADVARILGVTTTRIRAMDDVLKPVRIGPREERFYDPVVVERVKKARSKAKK